MITIHEKGDFSYQTIDGKGLDNGNMPLIQERLIHYCRSTDVYVDLGAHIGSMSIPVVAAVKPILAIFVEANPTAIPLLEENCKNNLPEQNVLVLNRVVCDRDELVTFSVLTEKEDSSSFVRPDIIRGGKPVEVLGATLDTLLEDIHGEFFMKVDIECAEFLMWKGMDKVIPRIRGMIMEWFMNDMTKENAQELLNMIRAKDFMVVSLDGQDISDEKLLAAGKEDIVLLNRALYKL